MPNHYTHYLLSIITSILLGTAAFNYYSDPYQIFSARPAAVFSNKPAVHPNMRMHKAHQVNLQKPDTLMLGTSKAIQGYSVKHPAFNGDHLYNNAVPLASMKEMYLLLQHAMGNGTIKKVFLSVDFLSFNALARADGAAAGLVIERFRTPEHPKHTYTPDYLAAILSFDALKASYHSLIPPQKAFRVLNGLGGRENAELVSHLADGGHASNALFIEDFFLNTVYLPTPNREFEFGENEANTFHWFERFVQAAYEANIELSMAIGPSHARLWELVNIAGLWPKFETWKKRLVEINEAEAAKHALPAYPLWDFSGLNTLTTESFPDKGDTDTRMRYYYESVHFSQEAGRLVLNKVYNLPIEEPFADDFGQLLTTDNITDVLDSQRQKQLQFRLQSPQIVKQIEGIMPKRRKN